MVICDIFSFFWTSDKFTQTVFVFDDSVQGFVVMRVYEASLVAEILRRPGDHRLGGTQLYPGGILANLDFYIFFMFLTKVSHVFLPVFSCFSWFLRGGGVPRILDFAENGCMGHKMI